MTPVERLARALHDAEVGDYGPCVTERQCIESYEQTLPAALTAALDVDELAEVIDLHREDYDSDRGMYYGCHCGWDNGTDMHNNGYTEHVARAVIAHLTKGDENDE